MKRQQDTAPPNGDQSFASSDYFGRLADQYQTFWREQFSAWRDMFRLPSTSSPTDVNMDEASKWFNRGVDIWGSWFSSLRDIIVTSGQQVGRATPILAFVVDAHAETSVAQAIKLADPDFEPSASDLFALRGPDRVSREHVAARIEGDQLRVSLVDLGHTTADRAQRAIVPGRYIGGILRGSASSLPAVLLDVTVLG